jgi:hypothetical protein
VSIRVRVLIVATAVAGATVCGITAPQTERFSSILRASESETLTPPHNHPVDFNGNEVRRAIARYKVDPTGALYEEHSPDIEVPRLGAPKG